MDSNFLLIVTLCMGLVSYAMKAVPLVFCKGKVKNKFLSSFLYYIPFAVMTSILVPEVFKSTSSIVSSIAGVAAAVVLGLLGQGMVVIALSSTAIVFIVENFILRIF